MRHKPRVGSDGRHAFCDTLYGFVGNRTKPLGRADGCKTQLEFIPGANEIELYNQVSA